VADGRCPENAAGEGNSAERITGRWHGTLSNRRHCCLTVGGHNHGRRVEIPFRCCAHRRSGGRPIGPPADAGAGGRPRLTRWGAARC